MQSGSDDFLRFYIGQLVVIRRDNDERDKSRVDRVVAVSEGYFKLENEGWILPGDVMFTVSPRTPAEHLIEQAMFHQMSALEAQALPEQVRAFEAQSEGPTYKQFQELLYKLPDQKLIKIRIQQVRKAADEWQYIVAQGGKQMDSTFSDSDIQTFIEKGYLPMDDEAPADSKPDPADRDLADREQQIGELTKRLAQLMAVNEALQKQIAAQQDLAQALTQMTRVISQQSKSRDTRPIETMTYKQFLSVAVQEGDPTDADLNRLLQQGWMIVSDQVVLQPGKDSPLRVVRLERSLAERPQLSQSTDLVLYTGPMSLGQELIMNGIDATKSRLNKEAIRAARQRFDARKASLKATQQGTQQGAQSS
ncbi:hypothetical protein G4Y79_05100 [Phototrophicus methaneseepsis]|uniref:Uncharacterized protein n=1 Tax=Phototrophicus methaneseepsis TaxID=2710758 RepID=A0A7S8IFM6_9CHLR|nr:hypothetical protein [Phototrophicus methaneseepsis]QPC83757.1 hypothetical protein G4Y79_05100 [Phototrophicus methaneseepsis]